MLYHCSNCQARSKCRGCLACQIKIVLYCSKRCRLAHADTHRRVCGKTHNYEYMQVEHEHLTDICRILSPIVLTNMDDYLLVNMIGMMLSEYSTAEPALDDIDESYHTMLERALSSRYDVVPDEWKEYTEYVQQLKFRQLVSSFRALTVDLEQHSHVSVKPPTQIKIHDVSHVDRLRLHQPSPESMGRRRRAPPAPPAPTIIEGELEWTVEKITNYRWNKNRHEFLVRWQGYPPEDDTWEPLSNLDNCKALVKKYKQENGLVLKRGKV